MKLTIIFAKIVMLVKIIVLAIGILLVGCKSGGDETLWGAYNEPVAAQPLPTPTGPSELQVLWRRDIGDGAQNGYAILRPAVVADYVYAADRRRVVKLAADSGNIIWSRNFSQNIFSGVGASTQLVAIALENGMMVALDSQDGNVLWETPLNRQISAVPAVGQGRVIARTVDGMIIALQSATGRVIWSLQSSVPELSIHGDSSPVISGDLVFVGLSSGKLLAANVISGREYWRVTTSFIGGQNEVERLTDSDSTPLVSGGTVFTAIYQGDVAAVQLDNAALKWRTPISSRLPMALGDGQLIVTAELGDMHAVDAFSGELLWSANDFRGHGMSAPIVVGRRVIVGDATGRIYSLAMQDGTLLDSRQAVSGAVIALVAGDAQFIVLSAAGDISALTFTEN